MDSIEGIKIDCDEGGFFLVLEGDFVDAFDAYLSRDECTLHLRLPQDVAVKLALEETKQIRLWWQDGQDAAAVYQRERLYVSPEDDCGYDLNDTKHPTFHDRMSEYTDRLRKQHLEK